MTHDLFGKLKYKETSQYWAASVPLPRFAEYGARPAPPPPTEEDARRMIADMNRAIDDMRGLMRERFGPAADDAFAEIDAEVDPSTAESITPAQPDPERARRRQEAARKRADRLARGRYPVRVADPDGRGPTPHQEAAFRHLTENEPAVLDAVLAEVCGSFRSAYGQDDRWQAADIAPAATPADLRGRFGLARAEITREHRRGFSHIAFTVDSDWQDEHGLFVVYSPDAREATWTSYEGLYDLVPTDDPPPEDAEYIPTPHDELVEAVLNGNEARARELVAAGADINALAPDEYPPLCMAVDQLEVEEVRRLLAFGADPNLADPEEQKTPLKMAKRTYKEMGFGPTKKKDALYEAMMTMAREAAGKQFEEMKTRLEEIIQLLEGAGGK